jgi:hypothetical protein
MGIGQPLVFLGELDRPAAVYASPVYACRCGFGKT